jgi:hypothetical protein
MKKKTTIKLTLTDAEKQKLRANKVKMADILNYAVDELVILLGVSVERVREIHGLAEFQTIPSIGVKFAEDLIFLGLYSISELKESNGAHLLEAYEFKKGFTTDPCVEDQFRLVVHYANTYDATKNWWDFTEERKIYRLKNGYPANRPKAAWHEFRN